MKKRFFSVVVAILMVTLLVLSACGGTDDLEKKIEELQTQIEDLQQSVDTRDGEIEDLNEQIKNLEKRIEELLRELRNELSVASGIYTLQEAYDRGYLTKDDLEQLAEYINNATSCPQPLESSVETAIKEAAAYELRNRKTSPELSATAADVTIVEYYGKHSDCYAFSMRNAYDMYPADVVDYWKEIGGFQFHIMSHDRIRVWIAK